MLFQERAVSVSVQETVYHHVGNGVTVTFAFNCQVPQLSDLKVYVNDVLTSAGFTVSGIGNLTGGSVTFAVPPANLVAIRIEREIALERNTDYQQNGDFLSKVVNPDFNRLWMALQQHAFALRRAILVPKTDTVTPAELPKAADRANKLMGFDANGHPTAYIPESASLASIFLMFASAIGTTMIGGTWFGGVVANVSALATSTGASLVGFIQAGLGAIEQSIEQKLRSHEPTIYDFLSPVKRVSLMAGNPTDVTTELQAAIDAHNSVEIFGKMITTSTIFMKRSGVRLRGRGIGNTFVEYVNSAGGTAFSGHAGGGANVISDCELRDFAIAGNTASTSASVGLDITTMCYSRFHLSIQTRRPNGICIYGAGNSGSSPYYNEISGFWFGGNDMTQRGLVFDAGSFSGGSNGPNANKIGPIERAASLAGMCDIIAGTGNMFSDMSGESIGDYYFRLNNVQAYSLTGTSTGGNNTINLIDTTKALSVNAFVNYGIIITGGTGAGQARIVASNGAQSFNVKHPWAVIPDATSTYALCDNQASGNKFNRIRAEGLATSNPDFIVALPGTQGNEFSDCNVESLGAGLYVRDSSGAPNNNWFSGSRTVFSEVVKAPGPGANINLYPRNSVFGGVAMPSYVVNWLWVSATTSSLGDIATVRLDVGGTGPGVGSDLTLTAQLAATADQSFCMPGVNGFVLRDGTNRHTFLNLQTGPAFSATADVVITWCANVDA